jgi:hypothetical protein
VNRQLKGLAIITAVVWALCFFLFFLSGCKPETCEKCLKLCKPFATSSCNVNYNDTVVCGCDVTRQAPVEVEKPQDEKKP